MIRALHVDRAVKPALPLGDVIRDIRQEIRVRAVALAHDAVFVVADSRWCGARARRLVRTCGPPRRARRRSARRCRRCRARIRDSTVELHAERLQVEVLLRAQRLHGELANVVRVVAARVVRMLRAIPLRDLADVLTVIAAVGDRRGSPGPRADAACTLSARLWIWPPPSL